MDFSDVLKMWYEVNKRDLPWRNTKSPYRIWLSEIILQQTRVDQGLPYYEKFVEAFPEVKDLANADEDFVMKLWQGLGYYSRARNLHAAAKYVVNELEGVFPKTHENLKKLKGVGDYTAAAVASFCYQEPVAVVDGNVYRVLSRFFDVDAAIDSSEGKKVFQKLADECLDRKHPDLYNQSIMEFGALQCLPKPKCETCPLREGCLSYQNKTIDQRPVKLKKLKQRVRYFNYLVIEEDGFLVLEKRTGKDIWGNLYQFPLIETDQEIANIVDLGAIETGEFTSCYQASKHVLSHQIIWAKFWEIKDDRIQEKYPLVVSENELENYAVPRLIENYLKIRGKEGK